MNLNPNIILDYALLLYRACVLIIDIWVFLIRSIGEYFRLIYRFFVPRPKRDIYGEIALITGAGRGIGRQLAFELAKNGCIIVCLDVDEESNNITVKEIKNNFKGRAFGYVCDVSNPSKVRETISKIHHEIGDIDILINNAGILCCKPFTQHKEDQIEKIIMTNLLGQLWVLRACLPRMIQQNKGSIVSMASFAGYAGVPNMVPYTASKFGVRGMMEALYIELRQKNPKHKLNLITVSPFLVDTGMIKNKRVRFPGVLDIETAESTAEIIVSNLQQGNALVFIPKILYYLMSVIRILPAKVQLLITDFLDSGIGVDYDND